MVVIRNELEWRRSGTNWSGSNQEPTGMVAIRNQLARCVDQEPNWHGDDQELNWLGSYQEPNMVVFSAH